MNWRYKIKQFGYKVAQLSDVGLPKDRLDLTGDRDIEWAWIGANLPESLGRVLDFGPATSYLGLMAAMRGGNVTGLDITPQPVPFRHAHLRVEAGDLTTYDFGSRRFETIINCSTVEHVGLPGRYGSTADPDGDLKAMARLRELMAAPESVMLLTIPTGRDGVHTPFHRVYGAERLPRLLSGFDLKREAYFAKFPGDNSWVETDRASALTVEGSSSFYSLGLFVLHRGS